MKDDAIKTFADAVREFERWVRSAESSGEVAARELLVLLSELYTKGLRLPEEPCPGAVDRVDDAERNQVLQSCKRLPLDYYGEVFNPLSIPPDEPCIGSLSDDVADIFREVVSGLRVFDGGAVRKANGHWVFSLNSHWGEHITGAIRALHCWLAKDYRLCSA